MVSIDDQPWFVAKDVISAIGLKGYAAEYTRRLDTAEVKVLSRISMTPNHRDALAAFDPKAPTVSLISESGLYKLIMRSDKPQAKAFQDWVTKEVLPSIPDAPARLAGRLAPSSPASRVW